MTTPQPAVAPPPPVIAAPQTVHSYTFVPSAAGATDLGGYFRLGGYSEIESNAADIAAFYPRLHGTDVAASVGGAQGIVLTCTGRMLIRAGEALYVHSVGAMLIDTVSTLAVTADADITVNSLATISITTAEEQSITIDAGGGTGDVTLTAYKATKHVLGEDWTYVTKDKYEYFHADSWKIQLGDEDKIHLGGRFTIWIGASITFNMAIDVVITAATSFLFYLLKFELGVWKFDFVFYKGEWKDGEAVFAGNKGCAAALDTATTAIGNVVSGVKTVAKGARALAFAVKVATGNVEATNQALAVAFQQRTQL